MYNSFNIFVDVAFFLAILLIGFAAFVGGRWMQLVGPRIADIAGGVVYGVGVFLAGLGLGYIVPLQTVPKWFLPRAAGVTVAKYRARTVLSVYDVFDIIFTGEK